MKKAKPKGSIYRFSDVVPPNFYGEIAKTTEGCHVLAEKGHVACFARIARDYSADIEDENKILQLKSVLWALVSQISTNLKVSTSRLNVPTVTGQYWVVRRRLAVLGAGGYHRAHH
jgi:hypothetical protein